MPKIVVVITVYNVEKYISSSIESVLNQSYSDLELILVDDGTPDNGGRIMDAYAAKDPRVKTIHQQNGGVMAARMRGLEEAAAEWITFLDGDDRLAPNALEVLLSVAETKNADAVSCGYRYYDQGGDCEIDPRGARRGNKLVGEYTREEFMESQSLSPRALSGFLYKTQILKEAGIHIGREIVNNEDFIFNLFLSPRLKKLIGLPDQLYWITSNPRSVSRSNTFTAEYWMRVLNFLQDNYHRYNLPEKYYLQYKLYTISRIYRVYSRSFELRDPVIVDMGALHLSGKYTLKQNILLYIIKHPSSPVKSVYTLPLHPKRLIYSLIQHDKS